MPIDIDNSNFSGMKRKKNIYIFYKYINNNIYLIFTFKNIYE